MGTVYLAYDSSLELKVAVKVISPDAVSAMDEEQYQTAVKRFQAEARQTSSSMIEGELISVKSPEKYYTDTSFRVARDLRSE